MSLQDYCIGSCKKLLKTTNMGNVDVSIIIVNYNTKEITEACINSVFDKTKDIHFELIVVDNGSRDGSREAFSKRKDILYFYQQENLGFGRANNVGFAYASGRNVLFLNSDTLLINNAVKILSDYLDANENIEATGGNLCSLNMSPLHSCRRMSPLMHEINILTSGFLGKMLYGENVEYNHTSQPFEVVCIVGADLMVKRKALNRTGGFDTRFFMFCEELDLCRRIRLGGGKITINPEAKIIHLEGSSFTSEGKLIRRTAMNRRSTWLYCSLHYGRVYSGMVDFVWKLTVWSRILGHTVTRSQKKNFWIGVYKELYS